MVSFIKKLFPSFLIAWYHMAMPFFGALIYGFPSKKIKVIGVTGTNGKSTTVALITNILKEAGYKTAMISSIKFEINEKEEPNTLKMTMPGRFTIQRFLQKAVNSGCQFAILEVSSEGIKQYRHLFIDFDLALITNLTPEHIESHGGFENYKKTKGKFFSAVKKTHILNLDDENKNYFLSFPAKKKWGYGIDFSQTDSLTAIRAKDCNASSEGIEFKVNETVFKSPLLGYFNIYNALAAICVGLAYEIDLKTIRTALEKTQTINGRMEEVISSPFKVFIDYAVTPDALEEVYKTLKETFTPKKMICVFGACGGGRDRWKRPLLGKIANQYCDKIILTNEDPYDEDPLKILKDIEKGISEVSKSETILDRKEAIKKALILAQKDDLIIITGKGSESWMCLEKGRKIPWNEKKTVKEEFEKIKNEKI